MYYHKNILKTSVLLWVSKSCYVIQGFTLNKNFVEKNINIQEALFFSFLKQPDLIAKFDNCADKNEAINALGFQSVWISL